MNLRTFRRRIRFVQRLLLLVVLLCLGLVVTGGFVRIDQLYYAQGVVRPENELAVHAPCAGTVKEILAREGDQVAKGAPLLRLDDWDLEERHVTLANERRELEAEIVLQDKKIARVEDIVLPQWLQFSDIDAKRSGGIVKHRQNVVDMLDKLVKGNLISHLEYEKARQDLELAEADLERNEEKQTIISKGFVTRAKDEAQAESDLLRARLKSVAEKEDLLKREWDRRTICAPEASTVTLTIIRHPGLPVTEGEEVVRVSASTRLSLDLFGPERDVDKVRPGQKVQFETPVFSSLIEGYCYGTVDLVAPDSSLAGRRLDGESRPPASYYIRARVDKTPAPLKFGSTVHAEITLGRKPLFKVLFGLD